MRYQPNRCALLESAQVPGHTVIFDSHGQIADESSTGYAGLSKEFVVFVKVNGGKSLKFILLNLLSFALLRKALEWNHMG